MAPGSKLSVSGGASIGAGYDTTAAPSNGMIIEGNVGPIRKSSISNGVNIGTTEPALKLELVGIQGVPATSGTAQTGIARFGGQTLNNVLDIGAYGATPYGVWLQVTDEADLSLEYPLVLNPNGGNVGIGTTGPNDNLTIKNSAAYKGLSITGGDVPRMTLVDDGGNTLAIQAGDSVSQIGTRTNNPLYFYTNSTTDQITSPAMAIATSGNVGIGTTGPSQKLDVAGNITAPFYYDRDNTGYYVDPASTSNMNLITTSAPTASNHVATKGYVDAAVKDRGPVVAMSAESASTYTHANAAKYCYDLSAAAAVAMDNNTTTVYTDWRLQTIEETAIFEGSMTRNVDAWTSTIVGNNGTWIVREAARIGYWYGDTYGNSHAANCVR